MAQDLLDFDDIVDAVVEELKLQDTDTTEISRIKRDINMIYLDEVVPFKRWLWLSGNTAVEHKPYLGNGTVSVTPDSTTITFSVAPSTSKTGYLFAVDSFNEIYTISAHTAGATTATLTTPYTGSLSTSAAYKVWTDQIVLPTDCRETTEVWHDFHRSPMEPVGLQEIRRITADSPKITGRPRYYTTYDFVDPSGGSETESDRYRVLKIYPAIYENSTTIKIDYIKEVSALDLDGDEPLMPKEDRVVLVYGALSRAWFRARNPEAAAYNRQLFEAKLARMAGKVEDGQDRPQLTPNSRYLAAKRARNMFNTARLTAANSGSSYSSPTYIKNATIEGGTVTANITVNSGITIDGRDISADGTSQDSHIAASTDVHGLSGGAAVVGTTSTQTLTNKTIDGDNNTLQDIAITSLKTVAADAGKFIARSGAGAVISTNTVPAGTVVGTTDAQTLFNKSLTDSSTSIVDASDNTKTIILDAGGTTGTSTTIQAAQTASRTIILPDATTTLVGTNIAQTLFNKSLVDSSTSIVDASDNTKTIVLDAGGTTGTSTTIQAAQTASRTIILPDATTTLVGTNVAQSLTNKSLVDSSTSIVDASDATKTIVLDAGGASGTSTTIQAAQTSSRTVILPDATTTLVGTDVSQTLTNKTIDADSNTITNIENADIKAAAAIALNKLAATTASRALVSDGSGFVSAATTTSTEIGYVNGVTSAIQTQLDAKTAKATLTTKGDLYVATAASTVTRLAVGSNGTYLKANSGATEGVEWASGVANLAITSKTTTYTAVTTDEVILVDTSGGAWALTLFTAAGNSGKRLFIKKTSSDFNGLTIDGNGAETIDGSATTTINTQYESITIMSDGTNWLTLDRRIPSVWTSYTPTVAHDNNTPTGYWRRVGDSLHCRVHVAYSSAPSAATFTTTLPNSLVIDTAKIPNNTVRQVVGTAKLFDNGGSNTGVIMGLVGVVDTDEVSVQLLGDASGDSGYLEAFTQAAPITLANLATMNLEFVVPISGWKG